MSIYFKDIRTVEYKGVTITVQIRIGGVGPIDYGYKTSTGIRGVGQRDAAQAEQDAMSAIDRLSEADQ